MKTTEVKICGITTITDANFAINFGADYLGFIFYPKSKRYISFKNCQKILDVIKSKIKTVAVLVDPSDNDILEINKLNFNYIQLHGNETVERIIEIKTKCTLPIIKAFGINTIEDLEQVADYHDFAEFFLFDYKPSSTEMPGGNAKQFDWSIINKSRVNKQFFLSGGLNIENIKNAINTEITNLFDVSSGVELNPGVKDTEKLKKFIDIIKN
mgnify:CR=1 FL=1